MNFKPQFFNRRGNKLDTILFEIRQLRKDLKDDVREIQRNQEKLMAGQASIDAATQALTNLQTQDAAAIAQLLSDFGTIQAEIAALQGQGVNTDALDAAVAQAQSTAANLDPAIAQITSLAPAGDTGGPTT